MIEIPPFELMELPTAKATTPIIFDIYKRGYGPNINVDLLGGDHELKHSIRTMHSERLRRSIRISEALIKISQAESEVNDGWTTLHEIVAGNSKSRAVKEEKSITMNHLRNISEAYGGIIATSNMHRYAELKATKPFGVAFSLRSKKALNK